MLFYEIFRFAAQKAEIISIISIIEVCQNLELARYSVFIIKKCLCGGKIKFLLHKVGILST